MSGNKINGNNGNHGKKLRSGRKSMIIEVALGQKIREAFLGEGVDIEQYEKIKNKITRGKGKVRLIDIATGKALTDLAALQFLMNKMSPDKLTSSGGLPLTIGEISRKKLEELNNK